jgi:hypothetical protein
MEATPAVTVIAYVCSPVVSSRSQPGMVRTSTAGSRSASQAAVTGSGRVLAPAIFMRSVLPGLRVGGG